MFVFFIEFFKGIRIVYFIEDVRKYFICYFREIESILDIFFIIENINLDLDIFCEKW